MIEHKIGAIFTIIDDNMRPHKLITALPHIAHYCMGCYFNTNGIDCYNYRKATGACHATSRKDEYHVIFKELNTN